MLSRTKSGASGIPDNDVSCGMWRQPMLVGATPGVAFMFNCPVVLRPESGGALTIQFE